MRTKVTECQKGADLALSTVCFYYTPTPTHSLVGILGGEKQKKAIPGFFLQLVIGPTLFLFQKSLVPVVVVIVVIHLL